MINRPGRSSVRSAVVALAVATTFAVTGAATLVAAQAAAPPPSSVEDEGANCAVSLPGSVPANAKLPDPFQKLNGSRLTSKSEWTCRREEIRKLAEKYVYGTKPAKPASVTGTVTSTSITVNVSEGGKSSSFSASVQLPSGTGPFPAVIVYGGFGADTSTIRSSGAAVISYDPLAVGKEGTARSNKQGAFYSIYGSSSSTGLLAAWAWGVSRIIDVIAQSGGTILRADATGVTGCSRYGKGAFAAGVFDQRIALTMPIESGSGGVPAFRSIAQESGAQPLSSAYSEQPWLGDAFGSYTGNPAGLPVDTHEMIGMIAPRGLFIMENPHIDWLAAKSGSVAALGGAEIYKALGAGDNISYWSDIQDGTHCAVRPEWKTPLQQNIQKFLLRTGTAAGTFRISSLKAGNLGQWRDWTTPTLSDGPTSAPPPTTAPPTTAPPTTAPPTSAPPSTPPPTTAPPTTAPPTTAPPPAGGCTASVSVNQWQGGFVASVHVTAGSAPINGWTVSMTLPPGAAVTSTWSATSSGTTGTVRFSNVSYNGNLGAGQGTDFGFQGTGTGTGLAPTCAAG